MSYEKKFSQILGERHRNREIFKDFLSPKIKELRKEREYSQREMAALLEVPVSTYANWEQGRREPSIYDIYNFMWTLHIDPNELFDMEELL